MAYRGKTPEFVVDIIKELVALHGQAGTARLTGLALFSVQRYLQGIGEPTMGSLRKLANYTGKTFEFKIEPER